MKDRPAWTDGFGQVARGFRAKLSPQERAEFDTLVRHGAGGFGDALDAMRLSAMQIRCIYFGGALLTLGCAVFLAASRSLWFEAPYSFDSLVLPLIAAIQHREANKIVNHLDGRPGVMVHPPARSHDAAPMRPVSILRPDGPEGPPHGPPPPRRHTDLEA